MLATSSLWHAQTLPWAHDFLRETFLPREPSDAGPRRIFISRGETNWRRLLNEPECAALLERRGFVPVRLAGRTVAEQAALFASVEAVAAPHDAGLTNLVFCKPGTRVVELFSPGHLGVYFTELSAVRGLEYFCLLGRAEPTAGRAAYRVDVEALERLCDLAGL